MKNNMTSRRTLEEKSRMSAGGTFTEDESSIKILLHMSFPRKLETSYWSVEHHPVTVPNDPTL